MPKIVTVHIPLGYALAWTTDAVTSGQYTRLGDPGGTVYTPTVMAVSTSYSVGPFNEPRDYQLLYQGNTISYTLSESGIFTAVDTEAPIWKLVTSKTASSSASLEFTSIGDFAQVMFVLTDIIPSTDNTRLELITSTNNGATYDTAASDYGWVYTGINTAGTSIDGYDDADDSMNLAIGIGNDTGECLNGEIKMFNPAGTTAYKHFVGKLVAINSAGALICQDFAGRRLATADIDAVKFRFVTGNIASGTIYMYSLGKS